MQLINQNFARFGYSCGLIALCLSFTGCQKVIPPTNDQQAPSLVWNVYNRDTEDMADYPATTTITAVHGARYRIALKADNPGGVSTIDINQGGGQMTWNCGFSPKSAPLVPVVQTYVAPDPNGAALTGLVLLYDVDFTMDCAGAHFWGGKATLAGGASNYSGTPSPTGYLTFVIN